MLSNKNGIRDSLLLRLRRAVEKKRALLLAFAPPLTLNPTKINKRTPPDDHRPTPTMNHVLQSSPVRASNSLMTMMMAATPSSPPPSISFPRRTFLFFSSTTSTALSLPSPPAPPPDTTITDRIFMDFSLCPTFFRPEGTDPTLCSSTVPLGRLIIGLYGHLAPITVSNFKAMCSSRSLYRNTLVHKIFPGQFFLAGRQGLSRRDSKLGELHPPLDFLPPNTDTLRPNAFLLKHSRGGVVSLCLSENDDDPDVKLDPHYRNVEFLITTGPGPCPQLDNKNVVFGTVLQGLDVVAAIASIPTYKPSERIQKYNELAAFIGDKRADTARAIWNRPLKTVYISDCGELKLKPNATTKPSLSPTLP